MQILVVDIGTGTQDILLFDSERAPENCLKLVMPAPTVLVGEQIRRATAARRPLLLQGVVMGGGPCTWAVEAHRRAGLRVLATPDAARTFNDDLEWVQRELGVEIVSEEEGEKLAVDDAFVRIELRDFDFRAIERAFAAFGMALRPAGLALAVFDHGAAPPGVSDRQFRMEYLSQRLRSERRLSTFAFRGPDVPAIMTRLRALAETAQAQAGLPVVVMDTAPAAILGALDDLAVRDHPDGMIVNVGNFHTLACQLRARQPARLFEHHTGLLSPASLNSWLQRLAQGTISHQAVFADQGHGALILDDVALPLEFVAVTGPRQALIKGVPLPLHCAVPHGDQMLCGCFGLLRAAADVMPEWREAIVAGLEGAGDQGLW